jgi:hypothetical protein
MGGQRTVSGDRRRRGEGIRGCVRDALGMLRDPAGGWRPVRGASVGSLGAVLPPELAGTWVGAIGQFAPF